MFSITQEIAETASHLQNSEAGVALATRLEKEGMCGMPLEVIFKNTHQFRRILWIARDMGDKFTSIYDLNSHPTWGYEENGRLTLMDVVNAGIDPAAVAAAFVEAVKNAPTITMQTKHHRYSNDANNNLKIERIYRTYWSDGRFTQEIRGSESAQHHQETLNAFRNLFGASVVDAWRNSVDGPLLGCTDSEEAEFDNSIYLMTRTEKGTVFVCLTGGFSL